MTFSLDDHRFMARALHLAERGLYTTDPNPRVGCVLVKDGQLLAEGWHRKAGEGHAERNALAQIEAAQQLEGATCYVTLEPCSHIGRTGPCADALIDARVARVVVAMQDPNPHVAGAGLEKLRNAGIQVQTGLLESAAHDLNPGFIKRMETGLPLVRVKVAGSLDGRTAMASGESQWITGPAAREDVQRLRARSSAVVTGVGTVLADAPSLTVRPQQWQLGDYGTDFVRQPLRVVLDGALRTPADVPLVQLSGSTLLITQQDPAGPKAEALVAAGAEVLRLPGSGSGLDLHEVLKELARRECNEVLIECGPTLAAAFVREKLVDELVLYMAPVLLGSSARPLLLLPEIEKMADKIELQQKELRQLGEDLRITFALKPKTGSR